MTTFLDRPLGSFLDDLAEHSPAPGGGSAAAVATAMAAGLVAMVARASRRTWPDAGAVAAQAEALRARSAPLAHADARAYGDVLRLLDEPGQDDPARRDFALGQALSQAAELPLKIGETACDVAQLGARGPEGGEPRRRPAAAAAVALAEAAASIAAELVHVNLATLEGDERIDLADALAAAAQGARRAVASRG